MIPGDWFKIPCGYVLVKASDMLGDTAHEIWKTKYFPVSEDCIQLSINSLFFKTGERKVILDPGMTVGYNPGDSYGVKYGIPPTEQLKALGILPEEVTDVILTHLHFDHCAGIFIYNRNIPVSASFPSATLHVSYEQYKNINHPPDVEKGSFIKDFLFFAQKFYALNILNTETGCIFESIKYRKFHGHSPGMIIPYITLGNSIMVYTSDLIPLALNAEINVVSSYDVDREKSQWEMRKFLEEFAANNYMLFLFHEEGNNILMKESLISGSEKSQ